MKFLVFILILVSASATSDPRPPKLYIGTFQLDQPSDDLFDDWLQCAGFKPEVQKIIQNPNTIFEVAQFYDGVDVYTHLTISNLETGKKHTEKFIFGKEFETEYFGSGKAISKVDNIDLKTLKRTLNLGGKKSQVVYNFCDKGCKIRYECDSISSERIYKRI